MRSTMVSFAASIWRDMRYGLRNLARRASVTAVVIVTLGLGIGATTAVFSAVNWLLLRPLPVSHPEQIHYLAIRQKDGPWENALSYPDYQDIRNETKDIFSDMIGYRPSQEGLTVHGKTEGITAAYITGNFFSMLGVRPFLGSFGSPLLENAGHPDAVIVLDFSYWKVRFGGDSKVIGKAVAINGRAATIIGIAPKGFRGISSLYVTQAYLPLGIAGVGNGGEGDSFSRRDLRNIVVLVRIKTEEGLTHAQSRLDVVARHLSDSYPKFDEGLALKAFALGPAGPSADPSNQVPQIAALFLVLPGLVFFLACINVTDVLLARAASRQQEMAVRRVIGAQRGQLVRQLLIESVLLALLGGVAGTLFGLAGSHGLSSIPLGTDLPIILDFRYDWRVFACAFGIALLAGVLVGIVPALQASNAGLGDALHQSARGSDVGRHAFRNALVMAQIGGSLALLIVAGLFIRSLEKVQTIDLGFKPNDVFNFTIDPHEVGYSDVQGLQFYEELLDRVRALPGVQIASAACSVPMGYYNFSDQITLPGYRGLSEESSRRASYNIVSPDYFRTMTIPIILGRDIDRTDRLGAQPVAVINEAMAKSYWPNQEPLGRSFVMKSDPANSIQVVGVVRNSRTEAMAGPIHPSFYVPLAQHYNPLAILQVRATAQEEVIVRQIIDLVESIAPAMPVSNIQSMSDALDTLNGLLLFQLGASLTATLGILGIVLAVVGVFGVVSYTVSLRTHEIGIRMALGERTSGVLKKIILQGARMALVGTGFGLVTAFAIGRGLASVLVGVNPADPWIYVAVSLLINLVALGACYVPAHRAARMDPMTALRHE